MPGYVTFFLKVLLQPLSYCEAVSKAAYRDEVARVRRIIFYFLSEPVDVNHYGVLVDYGLAPDDAVDHVL